MKTNLIKKALFIFTLTLFFSGCSEDFLEVDQRGLINENEFYKTDSDALAGIVAAYDILQRSYARDWTSLWLVKTLPADEIVAGGSNSSDQANYQELAKFSYTPSNNAILQAYRSMYFAIFRTNKILDRVEDNSPVKKIVRAEAKCLRAYCYLELTSMFGEVPLVLKELKPNEYAQPRTELSTIYAQIEQDLGEAIQDLPLKSELIATYGANHAFRVTKGTAQSLLGKTLLFQEKYTEAASQFDAVIKSEEYDLVPNFSRILRNDTEFGDESVFEISYSTSENFTWADFPWGASPRQENNIHWQLCGPRGDGFFEGGNTGMMAGWGFAYPTTKLFNAFTSLDTVRRKASIMSEAELEAAGGDLRNDEGDLPYDCQGFVRLKYGTWIEETSLNAQPELNFGTNYRVIRYADVLLMAAEAFHKAGNDGRAQTELNKVRTRAKLDEIFPTGNDLFDAIVYERQVELAFEGHRFTDLVRWGMAQQELGYKGYQEKHKYYPIPEYELYVNTALVQNEGY